MLDVAASVIINGEGEILIAQRSKEDKLSLKWEFPGGKIEKGETPQECLKREIMEELNLAIEVQDHLGSCKYKYNNGDINLIAYKATVLSGNIQLNVHNDAKWVKLEELKNYNFAPADIELINVMHTIVK